MARSRKLLTIGALSVAAFALAASTSVTGAFFQDSEAGAITGTIGLVQLDHTLNTTFGWANLLPGEARTASVAFTNTGSVTQDFYLVFPNATALSALNDLGTFGEVHVSANGTELFASTNLTDHWPDLSVGQPGVPLTHALPAKLLLASNVGIGAPGELKFTFKYADKFGDANAVKHWPALSGGGVFNSYPVDGQVLHPESSAADGNGAGLPFKIVAVQVGRTP